MTMTAMPSGRQAEAEETEPPKSRRKLLIILALATVLAAGSAWWFVLRPSGPEEPKPGTVMPLEAIQINLAGGHYLRLGIALQLAEGAEEVDGSVALDQAIDLYSGQKITDVTSPPRRRQLKATLSEKVRKAYHDEVLEVFYIDFVAQ